MTSVISLTHRTSSDGGDDLSKRLTPQLNNFHQLLAKTTSKTKLQITSNSKQTFASVQLTASQSDDVPSTKGKRQGRSPKGKDGTDKGKSGHHEEHSHKRDRKKREDVSKKNSSPEILSNDLADSSDSEEEVKVKSKHHSKQKSSKEAPDATKQPDMTASEEEREAKAREMKEAKERFKEKSSTRKQSILCPASVSFFFFAFFVLHYLLLTYNYH